MADGHGHRNWVLDNLGTIIMVITTVAAIAGNWFVMGERIDALGRRVGILEIRSEARTDVISDLKSDARNLDTRLKWLEQRQTRSFVPPLDPGK